MPDLRLVSVAAILVLSAGCTSRWNQPPEPTLNGSPNWPTSIADATAAPYSGIDNPDDAGFQLSDLTPSNLRTTALNTAGYGPDPDAARNHYGEAEELYRQATAARRADPQANVRPFFARAAVEYERAAKRWPDSELEQDALFRAGESYFFADRYPQANELFEQLVTKFPSSKYFDLAQARRFSVARYWLQIDQSDPESFFNVNLTDNSRPWHDTRGHALRIFRNIPMDDPTGKLADDAILAEANAFFVKGDYYRADQLYDDLRKTFPSSDHQFVAHFMGIKAKLLSYRGPDYAGTALDEAEKLVKQVRTQFPTETRQHAEEINLAYREIRYRMAEREWSMAEYYDRRSEYGAANLYYDIVVRDYSETPFAQRAGNRQTEIAGRPATPPQRLAWLVDLFPDEDAARPLVAGGSTTRR